MKKKLFLFKNLFINLIFPSFKLSIPTTIEFFFDKILGNKVDPNKPATPVITNNFFFMLLPFLLYMWL